jgi:hypothetical protein
MNDTVPTLDFFVQLSGECLRKSHLCLQIFHYQGHSGVFEPVYISIS